MKKPALIIVLVHLAALSALCLLPACVSSTAPVAVTTTQQTIANAVEDTLSVGLVPVLTKNLAYIPAARSIAAALGTFSGDTITPADVDAFLARTSLAPDDARAVAGIVNAAWATYSKRYSQQVSASLRPDVKIFLAAVANGINAAADAATSATASAVTRT